MAVRLSRITLCGFKSIEQLRDFRPRAINVLIGANGAGKSNFISFFRFLSWLLSGPPNLQEHIGVLGGASAILHDGPATTKELRAEIALETESGTNEYEFRLFYAAGDTLIFADERFRFSASGFETTAQWTSLGAGHSESRLSSFAGSAPGPSKTAGVILALLRRCVVHQFHNTSITARVRQKWNESDGRWLKEDGANLAPFLLRLRNDHRQYYDRIVSAIRQTMPFFADFELEPEHGRVLLQWRERGSDLIFNASQASDGMLRAIALIALLLQPEKDLPSVLILDEPELGLHPYAINLVAGLLRSASQSVQVIVATQSTAFINEFRPEEVVVVERHDRRSLFSSLPIDRLQQWLEQYSLAELWEKNVIGGRPSQ